MLKRQPRGDDKVRDDVLKRASSLPLNSHRANLILGSGALSQTSRFRSSRPSSPLSSSARRPLTARPASTLRWSTTATSRTCGASLPPRPRPGPSARAATCAPRCPSPPSARRSTPSVHGSSSSRGRRAGLAVAAAGGAALTAGTGLPIVVPGVSYRAPTQRDPWRMYRLTTWAKDVDREVEARGAECPLALRRWCKNWLD